MLDYNITNLLDLLLDNNMEDNIFEIWNNSDLKKIKPADIGNDKEDIRPANINK